MRYMFVFAATAISCGVSTANAQSAIQYTLGIEVVSNGVAAAGDGGDLATLSVGTIGTLNLLVSTDNSVFPPDDAFSQFYQILDLSLDVGSVQSGGQTGAYPSSTFFDGLGITDNGPSGSSQFDFFGGLTKFENPELGFSLLTVSQTLGVGEPSLVTGLDLPLSLDPSLATGVGFIIESLLSSTSSRVVFDVVTFSATPVPSPSSAALLGVAAFGMRRRR